MISAKRRECDPDPFARALEEVALQAMCEDAVVDDTILEFVTELFNDEHGHEGYVS